MKILFEFYIILVLAGFLITSQLPHLLGMQETAVSVQYRVFVIAASGVIIAAGLLYKSKIENVIINYKAFWLFWIMYSFRLIFDLFFNGIAMEPSKSAIDYMALAFGVAFIPSISLIYVSLADINWHRVLKYSYGALWVCLLFALIHRETNRLVGRTVGDMSIGILLYGHFGAALCLLSIFCLMNRTKIISASIYVSGFIIGLITIFVSASKSPFIALVLCISLMLVLRFGKGRAVYFIVPLCIVLTASFTSISDLVSQYFPNTFLLRFENSFEIGGDLTREALLRSGIEAFLNNPFFGQSLLIQDGLYAGAYPHNLIVESFMSLGFFGGIIFVIWSLQSLISAFRLIRFDFSNSWIALLFVQFFVFGMFSGSLFGSNYFWMLSILTVGLTQHSITVEHPIGRL